MSYQAHYRILFPSCFGWRYISQIWLILGWWNQQGNKKCVTQVVPGAASVLAASSSHHMKWPQMQRSLCCSRLRILLRMWASAHHQLVLTHHCVIASVPFPTPESEPRTSWWRYLHINQDGGDYLAFIDVSHLWLEVFVKFDRGDRGNRVVSPPRDSVQTFR